MMFIEGKEDISPRLKTDQQLLIHKLGEGPLNGKEGRSGKGGDMSQWQGGRLANQNFQDLEPGPRREEGEEI